MKRFLAAGLVAFAAWGAAAQPLPPVGNTAYPGTMELEVDASDVERRILRVRQTLPVRPGPLVLYYPNWTPGWHAPNSSIMRLAGLTVRAGERVLDWQRNTLEPQAFHLQVPAGVAALTLEFQYLASVTGSARVEVTREMLDLAWNTVLLYPAGHEVARIAVRPRLVLPAGWQAATALQLERRDGAALEFSPVSVETLVDSPVFAGAFAKQFDLDPGAAAAGRPPVRLNVVADRAAQLAATPEQIAAHAALVVQADRLFGVRHFRRYEFLLALSDTLGGIGLEHLESSENGVKPDYFTDWAKSAPDRDLLPHEYVHSWNGKFRRPAGLLTPHFNTPMRGELLWVYEGQTQFWGHVLAARSALLSAEQARDDLAITLAWLNARAGRAWRSLQDTTHEPVIGRGRSAEWRSWQRSADYYDEARLIWIEADALIRERSGGQRSLDDFARAFFGAQPGRTPGDLRPLAYGFDDVVRALERVQPHDWAGFLRRRLDAHDGAGLAAGLESAGWRLAWSDKPSDYQKAADARWKSTDFSHSLGFSVEEGDKLGGVIWDGPAFRAGIAPGATLLAVNGRAYKAELLSDAITEAMNGSGRIELLLRSGDLFRSVAVEWRGGLRYPKLERIEGRPDHLGALLAPR
jgi:predicted metalloprotease with PDZ domain